MKTISSFLLLLLLTIYFSCQDPDPYQNPDNVQLPPITMEGKNTFGCKVNGKVWIPDVGKETLFKEKMNIIYESDQISIQANLIREDLNKHEIIYVTCITTSKGIFQIPPPPFKGDVFKNNKFVGSCKEYLINNKDTKIEITKLDETKRIISGTFEFKHAVSCGDTIDITDGRFDVRY